MSPNKESFSISFLSLGVLLFVVLHGANPTAMALSSSSSSSSPIPPISVPVWSFATACDNCGSTTNTSMNIMTFCTPVSVSSPKLWALSFYHGTVTKDSFLGSATIQNTERTRVGILQLLKFDQRHLVPILGKNSGRDINKEEACEKEGFPWWHDNNSLSGKGNSKTAGFGILPQCALYLEVEMISSNEDSLIDAGDHVVAICRVTRTGVWESPDDKESLANGNILWLGAGETSGVFPNGINHSNALYTGQLREEGIL